MTELLTNLIATMKMEEILTFELNNRKIFGLVQTSMPSIVIEVKDKIYNYCIPNNGLDNLGEAELKRLIVELRRTNKKLQRENENLIEKVKKLSSERGKEKQKKMRTITFVAGYFRGGWTRPTNSLLLKKIHYAGMIFIYFNFWTIVVPVVSKLWPELDFLSSIIIGFRIMGGISASIPWFQLLRISSVSSVLSWLIVRVPKF